MQIIIFALLLMMVFASLVIAEGLGVFNKKSNKKSTRKNGNRKLRNDTRPE